MLLGGDEPGNEAQFCPAESLRICDISIPGSSIKNKQVVAVGCVFFKDDPVFAGQVWWVFWNWAVIV